MNRGERFQRHELALTSGLRLAPAESALDRERYLLYACVSRASERIVFSYRSSDEEGNLALPSPFIADVADLFVPEWPQRRRRPRGRCGPSRPHRPKSPDGRRIVQSKEAAWTAASASRRMARLADFSVVKMAVVLRKTAR